MVRLPGRGGRNREIAKELVVKRLQVQSRAEARRGSSGMEV